MRRKSTGKPKTKIPDTRPAFKTEAEEADWWASPEGRRYSERIHLKAKRKGVIVVEDKIPIREATELARSGKRVVLKKGAEFQRTDPSVLEELTARVKAKQTRAVSLRLPVRDIEAAKSIASKTGVPYQTLLKEIISDGLRRAG